MEATMMPYIVTTTLVNDRREALVRDAQAHRLAAEGAGVRRARGTRSERRPAAVVLRGWRIALTG
jgi:hypothetical protein